MAQQTAVEWLIEQVEDFIGLIPVDIIQQAKEIEMEQMRKCASFWRGKENEIEKPIFEEYYTETYKSELQQTERERNKTLMILIDKLIGENDMETIKLLESLVDKDTPAMKKSFEIMTKNINLNK